MAEYAVKVIHRGDLSKISVIADDEATARAQAKKYGRLLTIKKKSSLTNLLSPGMRSDERIIFIQRLAMMVGSRVSMGEALKIMRAAFGGSVRRASDELLRRIEQGSDFGAAIMEMRRDFPETTAALINSGVRGGDLSKALQNAADFEMEMDEISRSSSKGMLSAVGTFFLSALMIIGTSLYIGPWVIESDLMAQAGDAVDVDWIFTVSYWLSGLMVLIVAGVGGLLAMTYLVKPIAPSFSDRVILKVPIYRDLVLAKNSYTVFHGLGLLVESGVRMESALKLAGDAAPRGEVKVDLDRAYRAVRNGRPWAVAMKTLHPTDVAALSTSQDREQIAKAVQAVASQYRKIYTQRIQEVVPGMQLLAALFMSIGGGLIFGMIIIPMLQMTQGLM